jgi:arylsulfatase A-like enzyme
MKTPNILFIIMDSARAANFSCYGYTRPTTPRLDQLAAEGVLFEQAIAEGCWSLPVHTSLFTGLFPLCHGLTTSQQALPENYPTLARILKTHGYQTCCFTSNAYISPNTGLVQGFDTVEEIWRNFQPRGFQRTRTSKLIKRLEQYGPATKPVIRFIRFLMRVRKQVRRRKRQTDSGAQLTNARIQKWLTESWNPQTPFFMFVNYMECHEKYDPPHPYERQFMPSRFSPSRVAKVSPNKAEVLSSQNRKKREEDLEIIRALYDGELNYLDQKIGELLDFLRVKGILDETIVVVTADHGDSLGEHNHLGHRMDLYEQLVQVPLLVRYPARFQPGERIPYQIQLTDLFPTFLELAGVETEQANRNGFISLCNLPKQEIHPYTVAENTAIKRLNGVVARMIRTSQHKYIWKSNGQHELYDLKNDPNELNNLINKQPELASQLHQQLEAWEQSHSQMKTETRQADYDETVEERLRALGYVS